MAHRTVSRTSLAAGLAATLLLAPAGQAAALDSGGVTDDADDTSEPVDDAVEEVEETVDDAGDTASGGAGATAEEPADPVADTVEATTDAVDEAADAGSETTDGVREVVEKAASGDTSGAVDSAATTTQDTTDAVSGVVEGVAEGGAESGGDEPSEVPSDAPDDSGQDGPHRTSSTPRFEPDGGFSDRSASISSGFSRNIGGGNGSPSGFEPPATSGVFDSAQGGSDSAENPDIASLSEPSEPSTAGVPNPRDIPTSLVLTATALLALVGAGHVLHAVRRSGLQFG